MSFTIHKHIGGDWSIAKSGCILDCLSWDEMLGEIAVILMAGQRHRFSATPQADRVPMGSVYSLSVLKVEDCWYSIRRGGLFIDRLACNEALGFLAAYTLTDGERQLFHGLRTYEQWARNPWNREREISGAIEYQPEHVA